MFFMKKNVLTLFLVIIVAASASAQTEAGNWLVGGNLELNTPKNNTTVAFSAMAGYFFINNFAAGAGITWDYTSGNTTKTTRFGVGPFVRYYFGTMNVRPFLHGDWRYTSTKIKITST